MKTRYQFINASLLLPTSLLLLLCLSLSLITCKQTDVLPRFTEEGKNTFGCLINGKAYVPDGGTGFMPSKPILGGFLGIFANVFKIGVYVSTNSKDKKSIRLYLDDFNLGVHVLNSNTDTRPTTITPKDYASYISSEGDEYVTSSKYVGQINIIKADTTTGIVSGSFEFTAATKTGETVSVTNGRFDVNARTQ
jgi:hypothetical protein